jgi:hypothetical protein
MRSTLIACRWGTLRVRLMHSTLIAYLWGTIRISWALERRHQVQGHHATTRIIYAFLPEHAQGCGVNQAGMPTFPPGLSRTPVCADYGLDTDERNQSGDNSRSLRGQRRTGQDWHDEGSHHLSDDLNDLSFSPGAARSEFRSPMGDIERATREIRGVTLVFADLGLSSGGCN